MAVQDPNIGTPGRSSAGVRACHPPALTSNISVVERVGRNLLRDAAYERLRAAIVDGTLPPGLILRSDDIAERLGLSRAPIRDAIGRLTTEGLVESKPQ